MPKRNTSGRGGSRRSRGDRQGELFAQQITKAVEQAFAGVGAATGAGEATAQTAPTGPLESAAEARTDPPPVESPDVPPAQPETRLEEHPPKLESPRVPVAHEPCEPPDSPVSPAPSDGEPFPVSALRSPLSKDPA